MWIYISLRSYFMPQLGSISTVIYFFFFITQEKLILLEERRNTLCKAIKSLKIDYLLFDWLQLRLKY